MLSMSRFEFAKANRMELRAPDEERSAFLTEQNLGLHTLQKARSSARRLGSVRRTRGVELVDSLVCALPEVPRRGDGAASKFEQVHSSIHHVSQANALLRKKLEAKHQPVALTRENLLQLEEIYETNKPAIQQQRKQEFIRREMEKGRRSVATAEEKLALLRKIDEREEKTEAARKMRADSVLGDLRKARFRHLARMAQKRLQSVSPDVLKMEEEKEGLASQIDWYLKFCGENDEVPEEESRSGSRSPF